MAAMTPGQRRILDHLGTLPRGYGRARADQIGRALDMPLPLVKTLLRELYQQGKVQTGRDAQRHSVWSVAR